MRHPDAEMMYPDKVTVEEFIEIITDKEHNKAFIDNMKHIMEKPDSKMEEMQYAEEWLGIFAAWGELHMDNPYEEKS